MSLFLPSPLLEERKTLEAVAMSRRNLGEGFSEPLYVSASLPKSFLVSCEVERAFLSPS